MDFGCITPCGEDCRLCVHYKSGECKGCKATDGRCVKMWENGCYVYKCCAEHGVPFCGLCGEFPCEWLITKGSWNPNVVEHQKELAEQYIKLKI